MGGDQIDDAGTAAPPIRPPFESNRDGRFHRVLAVANRIVLKIAVSPFSFCRPPPIAAPSTVNVPYSHGPFCPPLVGMIMEPINLKQFK